MVPVEVRILILLKRVVCRQKRWIPAIAAKYFIGTLPALNDLDALGNILGQEIKSHGVVADHRLRHRFDSCRKHFESSASVYPDLLVGGPEVLRNEIRKAKFVA